MKKFDFIVVGSWVAWLSTAIFASKKWSVLLLTKEKDLRSWSSYMAQWWIAASENTDLHFEDTMRVSWNTSDEKATKFFVKNAFEAYVWLRDVIWVPFKKLGTLEWWHSERRVRTTWDDSGKVIVEYLIKYLKTIVWIDILVNFEVKSLLTESTRVVWVSWILWWTKKFDYYWDHIVLATWWVWQNYDKTTNPFSSTWDWLELAKKVWAEIINEDWIQWHPSCLKVDKNPLPLLTETLRWEWAYIVNNKWERFLFNYHKDWELAPRNLISDLIKKEEFKWKWIFLDLRHKSISFWRSGFPNIIALLEKNNFDITKDLIPITPAQHFICWWIKVDEIWATWISWLYAIWEVSSTGLHWKNRLPSNSIAECVVWAKSFVGSV